jgi:hypothetical protein
MTPLKPPKNLRWREPKNCGTCKHLRVRLSSSTCACERPDGPEFEMTNMEQYYHVCDYWREQSLITAKEK